MQHINNLSIVNVKNRFNLRWLLVGVFFIVFALGWKYPLLGFVVPLVMTIGIVGAFNNDRYVCGNLCPRGAFFDLIWYKFSFKRSIPSVFRNIYFRSFMFIFLITMLTFQISKEPFNVLHWGYSFWFICFVTTIVGLILGLIYYSRTWCAFCPMGSISNFIPKHKNVLKINSNDCKKCLLCEKKCPMNLKIVSEVNNNERVNKDCILCKQCVNTCPKNCLSLEKVA